MESERLQTNLRVGGWFVEVVSERSGRVGASERRWGRGYGVRGADIVQAMGNPKRMQAQGRWGTEKYCILGVLEGVWRLVSGICK